MISTELTPAFDSSLLNGSLKAGARMLNSGELAFLRDIQSHKYSSIQQPPGKAPCLIAPRTAQTASSARSLRSLISPAEGADTTKRAIPPVNLAKRSCKKVFSKRLDSLEIWCLIT